MSQGIFDTIIASSTSGNQLAAILNDFKGAVISGFSGTSRPSQLQPGGYWVDTTNNATGTWDFKVYDGLLDIPVFTINKNTGKGTINYANSIFEISKESDDSVGPILRLLKERIAGLGQTQIGDTLGELQFRGNREDGVDVLQARIKATSQNNVTGSQQGAFIAFEVSTLNGASISEVMRVIDGKVGIGTIAPEEAIHVIGNSKTEKISDDAVGATVKIKKKRIAASGQVVSGDVIGSVDFNSADDTGTEIQVASIETSATDTHTATAQGTKIVIKNKKIGESAFTEQIEITDNVKVKTNLTVEGNFTVNGTTTTVNSTVTEVADANITVNKNGTQSSANTNKAGVKVEMSDATHAQIGYDSSKASKFVIGEVGSEKEIVDVSSAQDISNKGIVSPSVLYVKQDTEANLTTYAATSPGNGQIVFATDTLTMYQVIGNSLVEFGGGGEIPSVAVTSLDIDWNSGNVYHKSISANSTFTFSNVADGRTISVVITNTSGSPVTIAFPAGIKVPTGIVLDVPNGTANIYTFMVANSIVYGSYVDGLA